MLKTYIFIFLISPFLALAQLSPEVGSLFETLNSDTAIAENTINASKLISIDNKFRSLASIATDDELLHVALHGTAALKECAIGDLVERKSVYLDTLFSTYLRSAEKYQVLQTGTVIETTPAVQLFKRIAWQKEKRLRKEYYERTTTTAELVELKVLFGRDFSTKWQLIEADSVLNGMMETALSYDNISNQNLNTILKMHDFKCNNYERVKYFAEKFRTPETLAALGTFKNPSDLPLLKLNFDSALLAISKFPHPSLFSKLRSKTTILYDQPQFQDAIASYMSTESKLVLEDIYSRIKSTYPAGDVRDEKLLSLYNIIEKKNCKIYQSVLDKISVY